VIAAAHELGFSCFTFPRTGAFSFVAGEVAFVELQNRKSSGGAQEKRLDFHSTSLSRKTANLR
jgi:hypothetical protein